MNKLIQGSSHSVQKKFESIKNQFSKFKRIAVFFDNENFLATDFSPIAPGVHMILEDLDNNQIHIQNCNCGYGGEGPSATVRLLVSLGINEAIIKKLVYYNDALQFELNDDSDILLASIDTTVHFYSSIRNTTNTNGIVLDGNVHIDLMKRKIMLFNPQYHCFIGMLKLLSKVKTENFEYYIGDNSPLDNYFRAEDMKNVLCHSKQPDLVGIKHVNLVIRGKNIQLTCLIDRQCEIQVLDSIYLAITHHTLFPEETYDVSVKLKNNIKMLFKEIFHSKKKSLIIHESIPLKQGDRL